jgi:hypothetical protein
MALPKSTSKPDKAPARGLIERLEGTGGGHYGSGAEGEAQKRDPVGLIDARR